MRPDLTIRAVLFTASAAIAAPGSPWAQEESAPQAEGAEDSEGGGVSDVEAEYPEEIPVNPEDDRERFTASSEANWGIPEALELYRRSEELYDEGRYQEAAAYLLRVIELDPEAPELYYNIALVYEHLQEFNRALEYLDRYSQFDIDASERRRVERMMTRIRGAQEHLPPTPEPLTRTRVVVQRFGRADGVFWGVFGATLAFAIGAGVTGGLALDWANATEQFTLGRDGDLADYRYWVNVTDSLALTTDILMGVAAGAAITALLLYVLRTHQAIEIRDGGVEEPEPGAADGAGAADSPEGDDDSEHDGEPPAAPEDEPASPVEPEARLAPLAARAAAMPSIAVGLGGVIIGWEF